MSVAAVWGLMISADSVAKPVLVCAHTCRVQVGGGERSLPHPHSHSLFKGQVSGHT